MSLRLLVVDAYDAAGRRSLRSVGATPAGRLYGRVLMQLDPGVDVEVFEVDDSGSAIGTVDPAGFDGLVWTGSNLTIHRPGELVDGQIALSLGAFAAGVPQFGSCWAIQLAAVAAGGRCALNPRGREFGVARAITATADGAEHRMLRGRMQSYEGFASHEDMVVELPAGALLLAGNRFCPVQALEIRCRRGVFWATQYHPEYDFHEVACLALLRREQLMREGRFADEAAVADFVADFEALQRDAANRDARRRQAVSEEVADPYNRRLEIRNWLDAVRDGALRS